jgi:hypothetical protein
MTKSRKNKSFWLIAGSMKSDVVLTDEQLKEARKLFSKKWAAQRDAFLA